MNDKGSQEETLRRHAGAPNPWTRRQKLREFTNAAFYVLLTLMLATALFAFGVGFGKEMCR